MEEKKWEEAVIDQLKANIEATVVDWVRGRVCRVLKTPPPK